MSRYLIVAHETVTNPRLVERVKHLAKHDPGAEFVLLVPATPVRHLLLRRGSDDEAAAVARRRAADAEELFTREGMPLLGAKVGDASPLDAIDAEVSASPGYSAFVISTLPKEHSRWLRLGLPGKVAAKYGLPVHHVALPLDDLPFDLP